MDNSSDDLDEGDDSFSEVSEEEIRKLDEAIIAAEANEKTFFLVCPSCGSRDLGVIPSDVDAASSGLAPWENRFFCRVCGHESVPLLFDDEEAYEKFCESKGGGTQGGVGA
jgi:hypothetical protein